MPTPPPPPRGPKSRNPGPGAGPPPVKVAAPLPAKAAAPSPARGAFGQVVSTVGVGDEMNVGVARGGTGGPETVTARRAGGLRDLGLDVNPQRVGVSAALQHLAKAVNVAFQADFGENELESVYQAAIVRRGQLLIVHREYFGFGDNWFGQFGRLLRSMQLTFDGPDPASPEGQARIAEKGPATIRGVLNLMARKLDLVAEYEDRVPAYVEQMFDRLEASGIIIGWDRGHWTIDTTSVGLDVRVTPKAVEGE